MLLIRLWQQVPVLGLPCYVPTLHGCYYCRYECDGYSHCHLLLLLLQLTLLVRRAIIGHTWLS